MHGEEGEAEGAAAVGANAVFDVEAMAGGGVV
jgi:hypothetical protein